MPDRELPTGELSRRNRAGQPRRWVGGWLTQALLAACACAALLLGREEQASVYAVGALIVGVIRQIEKQRRAECAATGEVQP